MSYKHLFHRRSKTALSIDLAYAEQDLVELSRKQAYRVVKAVCAFDMRHHTRVMKVALIIMAVVLLAVLVTAFANALNPFVRGLAAVIGVGVAGYYTGRFTGAEDTFKSVHRSLASDGRARRL